MTKDLKDNLATLQANIQPIMAAIANRTVNSSAESRVNTSHTGRHTHTHTILYMFVLQYYAEYTDKRVSKVYDGYELHKYGDNSMNR